MIAFISTGFYRNYILNAFCWCVTQNLKSHVFILFIETYFETKLIMVEIYSSQLQCYIKVDRCSPFGLLVLKEKIANVMDPVLWSTWSPSCGTHSERGLIVLELGM